MAKIIKNNLGNLLVILLIFSVVGIWIFSGWPRIWEKPYLPPEIQEITASPDPGYIELYQGWAATLTDTWQVQDLSGYGVPANAVVEVAVRNSRARAERWGGVRAYGSSLDRRFQLHEAEGGGWDIVVMHVQVDGSSRIEHYADNLSQIQFILLGYWDSGTYVETMQSFKAGGTGWRDHNLSSYGVGADQVAEIVMVNNNAGIEREAGVRTNNSSLERRLAIHEAEAGGDDVVTMLVKADSTANATIDVYAENNTDLDFYLVGYWSTLPTNYDYIEKFETITAPTASGVWQDRDLSGFPYNISVDGVAEIVLANGASGVEAMMGVRANGSSLSRTLDVQEAEGGGRDLARINTPVDVNSILEIYRENLTTPFEFRLVGHWELTAVFTTSLGDGADPGSSTIAPGTVDNYLDQFTFVTGSGSDLVTALTVTTVNTTAIASMEIWNETMTTQYFSTISSPAGNNWNFSGGTSIPANTSSASFRVIFAAKDHAILAEGIYAVDGIIASFTCTNNQAGTDTDSATITVDNAPPANATWGTITPGDTQIDLNWTNPVTDFNKVLILRNTVSVTDTPTEGIEYSVNDSIGSSIVRYVGSGTNFTDTGLSNGVDYYYKIFTYDDYINYAPGAGTGPHTPSAVSVITFNQSAYRWFNNTDSTDVGTALASQDSSATLSSAGLAFRLRLLLHIGNLQLNSSGENFKLQFAARSGACDTSFTGESYSDVTAATVIAYNDNPTPADGDALTNNANDPTHSGDTIVSQDYEEQNNFTNSEGAIPSGQDGQWDFVLIDNSAPGNTTYCLRVVKSDNSLLDTYTVVPEITTAGAVGPATPMADENTQANTNTDTIFRLRMQATASGSDAVGYNYRLEYGSKVGGACGDDESFSSVPITDTGEPFEMAVSGYVNNNDLTTNNSVLSDPVDFTFVAGEIVADPDNSSGSFNLQDMEYTEFEYVVRVTATASGDYCFKVTNTGIDLDYYEYYPEIQITP